MGGVCVCAPIYLYVTLTGRECRAVEGRFTSGRFSRHTVTGRHLEKVPRAMPHNYSVFVSFAQLRRDSEIYGKPFKHLALRPIYLRHYCDLSNSFVDITKHL